MYPRGRSTRALHVGWLVAWPALGALSAAWSVIPLFSLTRSLQMLVPVLLAAHSIRLWRDDPDAGHALWRLTLRLFVLSIVILSIAGFAIHDWPGGRFMWPWAQHPVLASGMVGFAFVALAAGGHRLTGLSGPLYVAALALLGAALAVGQTRSVLAGGALALLVALWLAGRSRPGVRSVMLPILLGGAVAALLLAKNPLIEYLSRGQSAYTLSTLNGRLGVWQLAIHSVASGHRWLLGFGQGSARVLLFQQLNWAGEAHNTWLEILLGTGLVGVVVAAVAVLGLGYQLFRPATPATAANRTAATLFVYLLVLSQADYYLAVPGFAFTALAFFAFLTMGQRGVGMAPAPRDPPAVEPMEPSATASPGHIERLERVTERHVEEASATILRTAEEAAEQLIRRTHTLARRNQTDGDRAWRRLADDMGRLDDWRGRAGSVAVELRRRADTVRTETDRAAAGVVTVTEALDAHLCQLEASVRTMRDGLAEARVAFPPSPEEDAHAVR
jgi:O-antigen ligase